MTIEIDDVFAGGGIVLGLFWASIPPDKYVFGIVPLWSGVEKLILAILCSIIIGSLGTVLLLNWSE